MDESAGYLAGKISGVFNGKEKCIFADSKDIQNGDDMVDLKWAKCNLSPAEFEYVGSLIYLKDTDYCLSTNKFKASNSYGVLLARKVTGDNIKHCLTVEVKSAFDAEAFQWSEVDVADACSNSCNANDAS